MSSALLNDANALYGGVMEKLPLPLKGFQKVEITLELDILNTDIDRWNLEGNLE